MQVDRDCYPWNVLFRQGIDFARISTRTSEAEHPTLDDLALSSYLKNANTTTSTPIRISRNIIIGRRVVVSMAIMMAT